MRISAVLACRNEQFFLPSWLESTATYADEILIAVNSPTDASAEVIEQFRQRTSIPILCQTFPARTIVEFGFSKMKNDMIEQATGDWVTSLDTDEQIELTRDELVALIQQAEHERLVGIELRNAQLPADVMKRAVAEQDEAAELTVERCKQLRSQHVAVEPREKKWKLFKNVPEIRWQGLIHEELYCRDQHLTHCCLKTDALLHHFHYASSGVPEWKLPLYAYLVERGYDNPALRFGTHVGWYDWFRMNEEQLRSQAQRLRDQIDDWFPK